MNLRIAVGWLEDRLGECWTGHPDDLVAWLAGDDASIVAREQAGRRATVLVAGGEIG